MKIIIFVMIFLILGALFIISNNDLKITDKNDLKKFSEECKIWGNKILQNIGALTGNAIKQNWLPEKI